MNDQSLTILGDLSKPATVLIEKISDAVGGVFRPFQIVRVAKAEAEAERIQAESQIQVTDLHRRAMHRFLEEEAKRQANIEEITRKALPLLGEHSRPQAVENDWITNFFDKSRIISNEEMQALWSRVLAGESNTPGAFSKQTVNLLADLDARDAKLFTCLCGFCWIIGGIIPVVIDVELEIYKHHGIHSDALAHLASLGLVQFNHLTAFSQRGLPKIFPVSYYGQRLLLTFPADTNNSLYIGQALLTHAGRELAQVCGSKPIEGFFDFVRNTWAKQSLRPEVIA